MTNKQIEAYEEALKEAEGKYDLPSYKQEAYQDFVVNLHRKGHELQAYNNGASRPCVVCEDRKQVEKMKKAAKVDCCVDNHGQGFVVYPKG